MPESALSNEYLRSPELLPAVAPSLGDGRSDVCALYGVLEPIMSCLLDLINEEYSES